MAQQEYNGQQFMAGSSPLVSDQTNGNFNHSNNVNSSLSYDQFSQQEDASPHSRRDKRSRSKERRRHKRKHRSSRSKSRSPSHSPGRRKRGRRHESSRSRSNSRERHHGKRHRYDDRYNNRRQYNDYDQQQQQQQQQQQPQYYYDNSQSGQQQQQQQGGESEEERILRVRRTVFAYHLSPNVDDNMLADFFSQRAGPVKSARLIRDKASGRSRGFGYIEFVNEESVRLALTLAGSKLDGHDVYVKASEAEKNIVQTSTSSSVASALAAGNNITNLFFKPVPEELDEEDLRLFFESVGDVDNIEIRRNELGQRVGFGYVKYRRADDAKKALLKLNNIDLAGIYKIKVGMWVEESAGPVGTAIAMGGHTPSAAAPHLMAPHAMPPQSSGMPAYNVQAQLTKSQQQKSNGALQQQHHESNQGSIEDSNYHRNQTRAMMIAKYKAVESGVPLVSQQEEQQTSQPVIESQNIKIENMFDPETETDANFDQEIKADVTSECSKYGQIAHVWVDKNSKGHVYLRFANVDSARRCRQVMHGRWFAKKQLSATYMTDAAYFSKFPELIL